MRSAGWRVVWLGTQAGMEAKLAPARGFDMAWVKVAGVRGKGLLTKLLLPFNLLIAFWQAARAIFRERPDVALGLGGYVAFPGGMMAVLLNKPLVIHEQNAVAGLTNKILARLADRVRIREVSPGGMLLTGVPYVDDGDVLEIVADDDARAGLDAEGGTEGKYRSLLGRMRLNVPVRRVHHLPDTG